MTQHGEDCECCSNGQPAFIQKIEDNIREHGCAIIGTTIAHEGNQLYMAYTIGLADDDFPELVVFGLPMAVATTFLNQAAVLLRNGTLPFDTPMTDLSELPCVFKKVTAPVAADFIIQANNRAGRALPAVQMFWPDPQGNFPWSHGFEKRFAGMQPLLYTQSH